MDKNKVHLDELIRWRKELVDELNSLTKEIEQLELNAEKLNAKYSLANKVYRRTTNEVIKKEYSDPLLDKLQKARTSRDEKAMKNNVKINAIHDLIENIDAIVGIKS